MKNKVKSLCVLLAVMLILSLAAVPVFAESEKNVGSWSTSPVKFGLNLGGGVYTDVITARSTVRTTVTPTLSGSKMRLKFSNRYGSKTLSIGEVTVAKTGANDDEIDTSTLKQVTFNGGSKYANIPAGGELYSDYINFSVIALEKISVSSYFENRTDITTAGLSGGVSYISLGGGNKTEKNSLGAFATRLDINASTVTYHTIPFFVNLDVIRTDDAYSVVIIGDSTVTNDAYLFLASKLQKNGITNVGVLNQGIIGNRVLYDGASALGNLYGESLMTRFKRDALDQAGCKYIIVKEGLNDILHPMTKSMKDSAPYVSTGQIIDGYKTLASQAEKAGKKIYITTRTPYKGYTRDFFISSSADLEWNQEGQNMINTLNKWITTESKNYYDGYIDLSKLADPKDSTKMRDALTLDGAHLSTYGQIAFADLLTPESYGVSKSLKSVSSLLNIDPYNVKVVEGSQGGGLSRIFGGLNDFLGSGDIADTLGGAVDAIGSVIGIGGSDDNKKTNTNTNSNTNNGSSANNTVKVPTAPDITIDTTPVQNLTDNTVQNDTQAVVANIQSNNMNTDSGSSNPGAFSTRKIVGVLLLSVSGVMLIAVVLVFMTDKSKPFGRDTLTRAARHLRS